jgi:hypothetical protein
MSLPDISGRFRFRRWSAGRFRYEEISGELGEPGKVMTHRDVRAQQAMSGGTGEHAGHRIGIQFGAPGDARNLGLQNANANTFAPTVLQDAFQGSGGSYHRLETEWANKLHAGWRIEVTVRDAYREGEDRPFTRHVEWVETMPGGASLPGRKLEFGNFDSPQRRTAPRPGR